MKTIRIILTSMILVFCNFAFAGWLDKLTTKNGEYCPKFGTAKIRPKTVCAEFLKKTIMRKKGLPSSEELSFKPAGEQTMKAIVQGYVQALADDKKRKFFDKDFEFVSLQAHETAKPYKKIPEVNVNLSSQRDQERIAAGKAAQRAAQGTDSIEGEEEDVETEEVLVSANPEGADSEEYETEAQSSEKNYFKVFPPNRIDENSTLVKTQEIPKNFRLYTVEFNQNFLVKGKEGKNKKRDVTKNLAAKGKLSFVLDSRDECTIYILGNQDVCYPVQDKIWSNAGYRAPNVLDVQFGDVVDALSAELLDGTISVDGGVAKYSKSSLLSPAPPRQTQPGGQGSDGYPRKGND